MVFLPNFSEVGKDQTITDVPTHATSSLSLCQSTTSSSPCAADVPMCSELTGNDGYEADGYVGVGELDSWCRIRHDSSFSSDSDAVSPLLSSNCPSSSTSTGSTCGGDDLYAKFDCMNECYDLGLEDCIIDAVNADIFVSGEHLFSGDSGSDDDALLPPSSSGVAADDGFLIDGVQLGLSEAAQRTALTTLLRSAAGDDSSSISQTASSAVSGTSADVREKVKRLAQNRLKAQGQDVSTICLVPPTALVRLAARHLCIALDKNVVMKLLIIQILTCGRSLSVAFVVRLQI